MGGKVLWKDTDLLSISKEKIRELRGAGISIVFQEPMTSLNPLLTVGRQISESLELHLKLSKREAWIETVRLIKSVGVRSPEIMATRYPHQFSGGMRQRIMIAMALACSPELLIADEPTTSVDVTTQAQILEMIHNLSESTKMAVILITHNLGVVARYAQCIIVMYAGHIVEQAPVKDIYASPLHPYTIALLNSVPRLDKGIKQKLTPIGGEPPDLGYLPSGCIFHPRCANVVERCRLESPPMRIVAPGHLVACWAVIGG